MLRRKLCSRIRPVFLGAEGLDWITQNSKWIKGRPQVNKIGTANCYGRLNNDSHIHQSNCGMFCFPL